MEAIRIKQRIESENLHLPIFKNFIGKNVEIIVLIEPDRSEEMPKLTKRVPGSAKGLISVSKEKSRNLQKLISNDHAWSDDDIKAVEKGREIINQ